MALPFISVVVPMWNARAHLPSVLDGLEALDYPRERLEVFVVDNASTDGSAELVRQRTGVRCLHEPRQGAYAARNRALREVRGEIVAFTDADCVVAPDWCTEIATALEKRGTGLICGHRRPGGTSATVRALMAYERAKDAWALGGDDPSVYYGFTSNMAVRRGVLDELGPFVERARGADTLFVRTVVERHGCDAVAFAPRCRVTHLEMDGVRTYLDKVRTYAWHRAHHADPVVSRALTTTERLHVFRSACRAERLPLFVALQLLTVLCAGAAMWRLGTLQGRRLAPSRVELASG